MFLNLIRRTWLIWAQTVWLWRIDVAINRYARTKQKMNRRRNAVDQLYKGYDETFGEKAKQKEITA